MSSFRVSIDNGKIIIIAEDEVPETDIIELLQFDETQMEELFRTHASIQARWEQIAINRKNIFELFKDNFEKKWWAHNKKFAKLLSLAYGDKTPTMDSIKDNVILIYSEDTSDFHREKYAELAFEQSVSKKSRSIYGAQEDFAKDMFKYLNMKPQWTYENLVKTVARMKEEVETLQNIAKRLEARSFHMKDLKDLVMEKHGNVPLYSYENREKENVQRMQAYAGSVNKGKQNE